MEQTMSDVPATRQPVPRPRWNDYQVFQRAAVSHASSILQKKKTHDITVPDGRPVTQADRQTDGRRAGSHQLGWHLRQLAKMEGAQKTELNPN